MMEKAEEALSLIAEEIKRAPELASLLLQPVHGGTALAVQIVPDAFRHVMSSAVQVLPETFCREGGEGKKGKTSTKTLSMGSHNSVHR